MQKKNFIHYFSLFALACLLIPSTVLESFGWMYSGPQGEFYWRLHPATLTLGIAVVLLHLSGRRPISTLPRGVFMYAITAGLCGSWVITTLGFSNVAFIIDSLLVCVPALAVVWCLPPTSQRAVFYAAVGFLLLNSALAFVELVLHKRLMPLYLQGFPLKDWGDARARSLGGHPLNNALITSIGFFVCLTMFKGLPRLLVCGFLLASMVAFGGRAALAVTLFLLLAWLAYEIVTSLRVGISAHQGMWAIVVGLLMPTLALGILYSTEMGQNFLSRLKPDDSAEARFAAIEVFRFISAPDLLLGITSQQFNDYVALLNQTWTIENSWVILLLRFGLLCFIPYVIAFFWGLLRTISQNNPGTMRLGLLAFVLIASSNNALAGKGMLLAQVCVFYAAATATLNLRQRASTPLVSDTGLTD
jgi:hypothetical protein